MSKYTDENKWPNPKHNVNFAKQLEKWNQVRQSLYSLNGWCSDNVNQISKWDVGDIENCLAKDIKERSHETGTNIWNQTLKPCPIVPDPTSQQWKQNEAVFNLENLNCLRKSASNIEYPNSSSCDITKKDNETNLALHLKMETLNLNTDFPDEMELALGT